MITAKRILYVLAIVAVILGIYGFYSRLFIGEREVNYGSYVNWGLWVAMYLFFAGMAAGSYMVAALDYVFNVEWFKGTGKYALWVSLVTLPGALVLIGFDLGHLERIWKVYLQPNFGSLLAQLVWGYSLFLVITFASVILAARKALNILRPLMIVGLVLAVFVSGGVGALLGVNASRASWHTAMLPAQFPILNLAAGIALMLVIVGFFGVLRNSDQRSRLLRILSLTMVALLVVKAYFLWVDYSQALYTGVPQAADAINLVLFGQYSWAFWGLQIIIGMIIPAIVLVLPNLSRNSLIVGLMGVFVLVGLAVSRTSIIFPALAIPELEGLATAFTGPHLNFNYEPSLMEWSVTVGVVGLSTLAFLIGTDWLSFLKQSPEVAR
jgi:molybdopterin-containing oxidoreductase family membrane subunit